MTNRTARRLHGLPAERLEAIVFEKREASGAPGIATGLIVDGELAWFLGAGWADLDRRDAPTEHSLARVASVTKTFTATAILQLRDRGLLELNDPLERHLPEFAVVQERGGRRRDVTIRALLTHRSGLVTESPTTAWDRPEFGDLAEILAALPETAVVVPAQTIWKYSNLGFALLGEVIARLAGRPYLDYIRAEILDPLGMRETAFHLAGGLRPLAMTGHQPSEYADRPTVAPVVSLAGLSAAGQLQSNVHDLARWVAFHLGTAPVAAAIQDAVLARTTRAEAQQAQYAQPDFALGQGLAWRMVRVGEHVFHNHGGSVHGFNSSVGFHVPTGIGVVVLANLWPTTVAAELAFDLLETAVGGDIARPSVIAEPPDAAPDGVRPFLGRYRADPGIVVSVDYRRGSLHLVGVPRAFNLHAPSALEAVGGTEGSYRVADGRGAGEVFTFEGGDDGRARSFAIGGFVYRRAD